MLPQTVRKNMIKSVHDDIHCGIAVIQKRSKLEGWWLGYSRDVEEYVKKCPKWTEIKKNFFKKALYIPVQQKKKNMVLSSHGPCIRQWYRITDNFCALLPCMT